MEEKNKPSKHSKKNSKPIKVAIFCIVAIVIFYLGTNFLKGFDVFSKRNYYYSVFDNSGGVYTGAIVYLQGYPIGKVTNVKLLNTNPVQILAEYLIHEDILIPKDSRFEIISKAVLSGINVRLSLGTDSQYARPSDTLACGIVPQMMDGLESMKDQLTNILASVDTITVSLKDVLTHQKGAEKLAKTLCNIESMTASLDYIIAENKTHFGKIVAEFSKFSETLTEISPELKHIVANFDRIADTIAKANIAEIIVNANNTIVQLEEVIRKVNSGEGDVAKLLNDGELYIKLGNTIQSLNELLIDLKQNPKKYINVTVFGGKKDKKE